MNGTLTLDGNGDPNSTFIFQTDSTLITGSYSHVVLINGAHACKVFWQVGSSATLGTISTFAGSILALTSITVADGAVVDGRALARNGSVTLDDATFLDPRCESGSTTTTVTSPAVTHDGDFAGCDDDGDCGGGDGDSAGGDGDGDRRRDGDSPAVTTDGDRDTVTRGCDGGDETLPAVTRRCRLHDDGDCRGGDGDRCRR